MIKRLWRFLFEPREWEHDIVFIPHSLGALRCKKCGEEFGVYP